MCGKELADDRPTLIYCRESRDENNQEYERIETQRDILVEFCKRKGLVNVVDIIMDDDCTGTSFQRFHTVFSQEGAIRTAPLFYRLYISYLQQQEP